MASGKYTLSQEEVEDIRVQFDQFDMNKDGHISCEEIGSVLMSLGEDLPGYKIRELINEVDKDANGMVEFNEFLEMYSGITKKKAGAGLLKFVKKQAGLKTLGGTSEGSADGTTHSFSDEEKVAFVDWINSALGDDPDVSGMLPISTEGDDLFNKLSNGIILCKMINLSAPGTIDERVINKKKLNLYLEHENLTLALNSAQAIGCYIVNIGAEDLRKGKAHLALGLLWQVIRIGLFSKITLSSVPGLARLLMDGETLADLNKLSPEEILLRWFNYHLARAGSNRRVNNFSDDIKDSECYMILLNQIAPKGTNLDPVGSVVNLSDKNKRAEKMLQNADRLGCRKFVRSKDVVQGNPKLNMAFVANLFNNHPGLPPMDEEELEQEEMEPYEETREDLSFRNWMNSLGVDPYVNNIYTDTCNGVILIQLFDIIKPGIVNWDKVNRPPFKKMGGKMKQIENCNYAIELGKQMKFSQVAIGGKDIHDGIKTLTLAVVWQMMRAYTLKVLNELQPGIKDQDIVDWVNEKLAGADKKSKITSFKDPSICTGHAVIDLIDAVKPGSVDYTLVTSGDTDEEKLLNARYALSMARKVGAHIYALPEDMVEVTPKMVMTIFACIMSFASSGSNSA